MRVVHYETAFDAHDVTSTVLDASGSLGPFLDASMASLGNTETPSEDTITPVSSPASESFDINDGYIELTDEFVEECRNTSLMILLKSAEIHMVLVLLRVSLLDVLLCLKCPLILSLPSLP